MNERASDPDKKKKFVKEDVSTKVLAKQDVAEQGTKKRKGGHMKMIARKRKRPQPDVDSDDEHRKCLKIVTFEGTIDSEIMERKSFISRLDKVSLPEGDYLVVYRVNGNFRAFNYLMEGDLKIMMESSIEVTDQGDFWNDQQDWEIVTWRLYKAYGVCILEFKDGTVIYMLVERKYPLSKELVQRMLDFGLEVEVESTAALDLIRVLNSPCFMVKSWLVQDQTVLGKDYSNLLIADSLLKTIWFINAPCYGNEALASPKANGGSTVMNQLKIDTLTPELLAGLTFELMKESCKILVELEYIFKEVYKETTDQLDWNNPEGQQYPHDLRKPLPLIPNSRGRCVIPFDHFINNDLAYLSGGVASHKYTTSMTKTKAADYGHIKWIEDLVPNRMESARDVYSKRRIIAVTKIEIVEWHNYKHLDWITVRRDDDKLYKFKEGDFNRLRIQDIEDMLLLLVQGKLTNLTVEERLAFNVSLRMFTRSIVIQRRVEDLQLGVESYQKKLNLTKPDTYRPDLKRREAYTAYSNPRGFIYQNKDKKNRLMRIDELHKFSDGTLDDVRTALNDRLKGIRMQYLPQTIWRQRDKDNAGAMIQAIDKQLKTRRIMRSLEKFVGGRPYEGDFRLLQRTI
ncbi:hypothetical protein Tco_1250094 [Tanacetum coccineum]